MATFGEIQDRINRDYLNRTDFSAETVRAIRASIRHYEHKRWWFNESSTAIATTTSISHIARPSAFFETDELRFFYASSASYSLNRIDMKDLLEMRAGAQTVGQPTHYAEWGERYELFPIPDSAWTITVHGFQQLAALSGTADTNAWTSAAEDLIVYHATKLMWATVLRNANEARIYADLERNALNELRTANESRILYAIKATNF